MVMSTLPPEHQIGQSLDRTFDRLGLFWDPSFQPRAAMARRQWKRRLAAMGALAAAGSFAVAASFFLHPRRAPSQALRAAALVSPRLPQSVVQLLHSTQAQDVAVQGSEAVFASYPINPSGRSWLLAGRFQANGIAGDHLSVEVDNSNRLQSAVLLRQGQPVATMIPPLALAAYTNSRPLPLSLDVHPTIPAVTATAPLPGTWVSGGPGRIESFAAAGPLVYLTRKGAWTALQPGRQSYWDPLPGHLSGDAVIAALPAAPTTALLVVQTGQGPRGFVTTDGGHHWQAWDFSPTSVQQIVAMGNQFWAVIDGSLSVSTNGQDWRTILPLAGTGWEVRDFAVDPEDPAISVVSLDSAASGALGPLLESSDGGLSWREIPNYPALGKTPADMVMLPGGKVAALVNLTVPVVALYSPEVSQWQVLPLPQGTLAGGQLGATPDGHLVYAPPQGPLLYASLTPAEWWVLPDPTAQPGPVHLVAAIGNQQVMAAFPHQWRIFVYSGEPTP